MKIINSRSDSNSNNTKESKKTKIPCDLTYMRNLEQKPKTKLTGTENTLAAAGPGVGERCEGVQRYKLPGVKMGKLWGCDVPFTVLDGILEIC